MHRVKHRIMETACTQVLRTASTRSDGLHKSNRGGDVPQRNVGQASSYALRAVALAFALGCMSSAIAQPTPLPPDPPTPPIPVEQMRAFGYTKEFAQRFALPEPEPAKRGSA